MLSVLKTSLRSFYPYAKKELGFNRPVRLFLRHDSENAKNVLGRTGQYNPEQETIVLYITNRHPKDILRSFAHELVHHAQCCRGELDDFQGGAGYAQQGPGEELEKEAYLGTKMVRDWEDGLKQKNQGRIMMNENKIRETIRNAVRRVLSEIDNDKKTNENKDQVEEGDGSYARRKAADEKRRREANKWDRRADGSTDKKGSSGPYGRSLEDDYIDISRLEEEDDSDPEVSEELEKTDETVELEGAEKKEEKEEEEEEEEEDDLGSQIAGAQSGVTEDLSESNDTWYWSSLNEKLTKLWSK